MYALRAPRRCQRRPRPLYSRAPAAPACFRSIARAETSPRSASPSVSVSVPPAATSRSVVRCLGSFAPDLSPSPASCSDPGVCDRMDDARTREPALRCVSGTPRGQGVSREYVRARMRAAEELDRPIWAKGRPIIGAGTGAGISPPIMPPCSACSGGLARSRSGRARSVDPPVADALVVRSSAGCVLAKTCLS